MNGKTSPRYPRTGAAKSKGSQGAGAKKGRVLITIRNLTRNIKEIVLEIIRKNKDSKIEMRSYVDHGYTHICTSCKKRYGRKILGQRELFIKDCEDCSAPKKAGGRNVPMSPWVTIF